ncbi:unnamed protein product [Amoebophrya sp. A120]|nr:unnamed protein product [Amoebophrya sp. A120]|eukprot:GSA120T00008759001.1
MPSQSSSSSSTAPHGGTLLWGMPTDRVLADFGGTNKQAGSSSTSSPTASEILSEFHDNMCSLPNVEKVSAYSVKRIEDPENYVVGSDETLMVAFDELPMKFDQLMWMGQRLAQAEAENAKLMQDFLEAELKCADLEDAMKELRTKRTPFEMQEKNIELKKQVRRLEDLNKKLSEAHLIHDQQIAANSIQNLELVQLKQQMIHQATKLVEEEERAEEAKTATQVDVPAGTKITDAPPHAASADDDGTAGLGFKPPDRIAEKQAEGVIPQAKTTSGTSSKTSSSPNPKVSSAKKQFVKPVIRDSVTKEEENSTTPPPVQLRPKTPLSQGSPGKNNFGVVKPPMIDLGAATGTAQPAPASSRSQNSSSQPQDSARSSLPGESQTEDSDATPMNSAVGGTNNGKPKDNLTGSAASSSSTSTAKNNAKKLKKKRKNQEKQAQASARGGIEQQDAAADATSTMNAAQLSASRPKAKVKMPILNIQEMYGLQKYLRTRTCINALQISPASQIKFVMLICLEKEICICIIAITTGTMLLHRMRCNRIRKSRWERTRAVAMGHRQNDRRRNTRRLIRQVSRPVVEGATTCQPRFRRTNRDLISFQRSAYQRQICLGLEGCNL